MQSALLPLRSRKGISLTALIDVVFILLMFFMLTSSFSQLQALALKSASAVDVAPENKAKPALVIVDETGQYYLNTLSGTVLSPSQLLTEIASDQAVVLLPYSGTTVQVLVNAMHELQAAGFEQLTLGSSVAADVNGSGGSDE